MYLQIYTLHLRIATIFMVTYTYDFANITDGVTKNQEVLSSVLPIVDSSVTASTLEQQLSTSEDITTGEYILQFSGTTSSSEHTTIRSSLSDTTENTLLDFATTSPFTENESSDAFTEAIGGMKIIDNDNLLNKSTTGVGNLSSTTSGLEEQSTASSPVDGIDWSLHSSKDRIATEIPACSPMHNSENVTHVYELGFIDLQSNMSFMIQNASSVSSNNTEDDELFLNTVGLIRWFYLPIILVGTIANIINLVVFSRPYMRKLSTIVYLSALAIADITNLYFELLRYWLEWMDWLVPPDHYFSDAYCKTGNYVGNASRDLANWLVAFVTIERIVVLAVPFRAKRFCTPKNARIIVCVLTLVVLIAHIPSVLVTKAYKSVTWVCWPVTESQILIILTKIVYYFFGYTVIALVFILNVTLIGLLYRARRLQPLNPTASNTTRRNNHAKRLTPMLLSVGIMFLVCEMPRVIVLALYTTVGNTQPLRIAMSLAFLLSGINHMANFFIYVLSGRRFRSAFINTVRCKSSKEDGTTRSASLTKFNTYKCSTAPPSHSNSICTVESELSKSASVSRQVSVESQGGQYLSPPSPRLGTRF